MIWLAVMLVAALIALDKSLLPGAAILGIGALANIIPAKEATGVTLALIIIADWTAIWAFRKNVDRKTLRRLLPNVVVGVVLGAGFLFVADDTVTRRVIGAIILVFVTWNVAPMIRRYLRERTNARTAAENTIADNTVADRTDGADAAGPDTGVATEYLTAADSPSGTASTEVVSVPPTEVTPTETALPAAGPRRTKGILFGTLAGFTTMVANAGGPVTSMYFMTEGFSVRLFLGTTAWFYLIINLVKLPFSLGLGMITTSWLPMIAASIPVIIATVAVGRWASGRINRSVFNVLIVILTLVTGVMLLV
ncbi:sulfite exporter TauE/SafE family protein [Raineyella sp. W15-4]|uniref:sulfite exporter TauE/SafE family protein n=1 Tax=Raineyella sp. W15-4 TaxID=3081651 RepID=UPI00295431FA|nr:sulfite exporter TauE/SafE family protein [Raineyella sp. W15-4]WOQ15764.1 sulfite exporter TauE/SafE family protein [Raineyella sp. W15-4]